MPGHALIEAPYVVLVRIAGERGSEGHDRSHTLRMFTCKLPGKNPAKAPADEKNRLRGDRVEARLQAANGIGARAPIPAKLPAMNAPPRLGESFAQCQRRSVGGDEAGNDQCWRPIDGSTRAQMSETVPESREQGSRFVISAPCGRRPVVAFEAIPQRNSPPSRACNALGNFTRPSSVWWFSSSGTRIRGLASAVLLSVCANRTFPSLPR